LRMRGFFVFSMSFSFISKYSKILLPVSLLFSSAFSASFSKFTLLVYCRRENIFPPLNFALYLKPRFYSNYIHFV
jgi:hypothetical protein